MPQTPISMAAFADTKPHYGILEGLPGASGVVVGSIILAYICLKCYDIPVRKYLTSRFLKSKKAI